VFLSIPLFGAALSLFALRRIAESDGALAGRWAAASGLALCVASAVASMSHVQATRYLLTSQAKQFGREWLGLLVSGDVQDAFNLTVESTRIEPSEPPANLPGGAPPEPPYPRFVKNPLIQALASTGTGADIRFGGTLVYDRRPDGECVVQQRFDVTRAAAATNVHPANGEPVEVVLTLQRSRLSSDARVRWLVLGYGPPNQYSDAAE
jgi:hypothetical protein